jgi:hypothetical protein
MSSKRLTLLALAVSATAAVGVVLGTGADGLPSKAAPKCQFFPKNNPWNQRVDGQPVQAGSGDVIDHFGPNTSVFADFSMPWIAVPGTQKRVPVRFHYWQESDRGRYPIPPNAPIEPGTPDRHVIVLDRDHCKLYEIYKARRRAGGKRWRAGAGAIWNLNVNHFRPRGYTSADAAGLPILPGLVRYDEVQRGEIDHAIRFTAEPNRPTYVYPASHSDGYSHSRSAPPMGARFRLRPNFDTSSFPPQSRVILEGLKRYGMILADSGPAYSIIGAPSSHWDWDDLDALTRVKGRDLQVVNTRGLPQPGR